jgi:hypothetical protein
MSDANTSDPRSLVCDRCWMNLVNTQAYEDVCLRRSVENSNEPCTAKYVSTLTHAMAEKSCSWCRIVCTLMSSKADVDQPLTVAFSHNSGYSLYGQRYSLFVESGSGVEREEALILSTTADDPAAQHITTRPLQRDVSVKTTTPQIRSWLQECTQHEDCSVQADVELPTRVIELDPFGNSASPRLIETAGRRGQYATLSYCWGPRPHGLLTVSNLKEYMRRLPVDGT